MVHNARLFLDCNPFFNLAGSAYGIQASLICRTQDVERLLCALKLPDSCSPYKLSFAPLVVHRQPSVLQLKHCSGRWNQSALHRSHMPEGREKACLCRGCDPSSTTGIQPTDRMLFKMTECCGSDRLHPASRQCFRPTTVSALVHLLSYVSLSEVGMLGMYRCLASRRQTPCNCHAKKIGFPHKHSCVCAFDAIHT